MHSINFKRCAFSSDTCFSSEFGYPGLMWWEYWFLTVPSGIDFCCLYLVLASLYLLISGVNWPCYLLLEPLPPVILVVTDLLAGKLSQGLEGVQECWICPRYWDRGCFTCIHGYKVPPENQTFSRVLSLNVYSVTGNVHIHVYLYKLHSLLQYCEFLAFIPDVRSRTDSKNNPLHGWRATSAVQKSDCFLRGPGLSCQNWQT